MNKSAIINYTVISVIVTVITVYYFLKVLLNSTKNKNNGDGWGTKIGLVMAMAGNAVGLGNFLRFPVQAINHGGGAFIFPYLVCFLLIGVPLLFVEWSMGRFAGIGYPGRPNGDHNIPFIIQRMSTAQWVKYLGVFGMFINIAVAGYYCYIESWTLSYVFHSVINTFHGMSQAEVSKFFDEYTTHYSGGGIPGETFIFYVLCILINVYYLANGLKGGIEKVALYGMPLLIIFGAILAFQSLTLQAGQHGAINSGIDGLRFLWTPDYTSIWKPSVWIAAAGQIFFTLAVGMASIQCYASYMKKDEDVALGAMSAGWMNEFVEIVLGSAIIIPITAGYLGIDGMSNMVKSIGGFGMGFKTMPYLFQEWGTVIAMISGVFWFGLLFIAGITSSLAMGTPIIGFLNDEFGIPFKRGAKVFGLLVLVMGLPTILFYNQGVFNEFDDWAGTYSLVIFGFLELILYAWVWGIDKGWHEINRGAEIKVPGIVRIIIKYVTPCMLGFILISNIPTMFNRVLHPANGYIRFAQLFLLALFVGILLVIRIADKKRKAMQ